jgi:hypothetical protein
MSKMDGPLRAPLGAGTSSKLVEFPESAWNNEEKKRAKRATPTRNYFLRSILNCFETFSPKAREKKKSSRAQRILERRILRTPTVLTLSLSKMDSNIEAQPYKWPHDSSFDPKTTALVIIDMQKDCKYCEFIFRARLPSHFSLHHVCKSSFSITSSINAYGLPCPFYHYPISNWCILTCR